MFTFIFRLFHQNVTHFFCDFAVYKCFHIYQSTRADYPKRPSLTANVKRRKINFVSMLLLLLLGLLYFAPDFSSQVKKAVKYEKMGSREQ